MNTLHRSPLPAYVDPQRYYTCETIATIWGISRDKTERWRRVLRDHVGQGVLKNGHRYVLNGQAAFETFGLVDSWEN